MAIHKLNFNALLPKLNNNFNILLTFRDRRDIIARNMSRRQKRQNDKSDKTETNLVSNGNPQIEVSHAFGSQFEENVAKRFIRNNYENKREFLDAKHEEIIGANMKVREAFSTTASDPCEYGLINSNIQERKCASNNTISVVDNNHSLTNGIHNNNNGNNVGVIELQATNEQDEDMQVNDHLKPECKVAHNKLDLNHKIDDGMKKTRPEKGQRTETAANGYEGEENLGFQTTPL